MIASGLLLALLASASGDEVYAVVVGHNGGLPVGSPSAPRGLPELRFADDDALRFAMLFGAIAGAEQVWLLTKLDSDSRRALEAAGLLAPTTRPPTRSALSAALAEVAERMRRRPPGRKATLYFVYAGHGLEGRFLLAPEVGEEAAITGRELRAAIAEARPDQASLFFDACRSQSLFADRGPAPDLSAEIEAFESRARGVRLGMLAAALSGEPAGEDARLEAGYFSHVLASGIAGGADADGNQLVSYGELAAFVALNIQRRTSQRPWFKPPEGDLSATVIDLRALGGLVLGPEVAGRFQVRTSRGGRLLVEVHKAPGRALKLTLPEVRLQVVRMGARHAEAVEVELAGGARVELPAAGAWQPLVAASRGEEAAEPDETRFWAPFTDEAVAALAMGYRAGQGGTPPRGWRHAGDISYAVAPAPFGLTGAEHALEAGYRFTAGPMVVGAHLGMAGSEHRAAADGSQVFIRRGSLGARAGFRLSPWEAVELTGWAGLGLRSVWREEAGAPSRGDLTAPAAEAGARAEFPLGAGLAAFLEPRAELVWVRIDGRRQPFGGVAARVGLSLRR